ncbi:MAG TPA: PhoH family protein [Paludibacteraceae bacterium]|nr:PhoH family protein [Paludibacteraceae bacterium]
MQLLKNIPGIARVDFDVHDIVRHKLVQEIVQAYEKRNNLMQTKSKKEDNETEK